MGRRAQGFRILWKRGWAYVRFTHAGAEQRIALRTADPGEAQARGADEYARALSGRRRQVVAATRALSSIALDELLAEWIAASAGVLDETTCGTLETYAKHYKAFFGQLSHVTRESARDYTRARLRRVLRSTVTKELSFLRAFLAWAVDQGALDEAPVIDPPPGKATGVRSGPQRSSPVEITESEALAIIAALPELSKRIGGRKWPVRARYLVAWETGLRPGSMASLQVPQHYRRGAGELVLEGTDDKARFGRTVPLSAPARAALDASAPSSGLIFGAHCFDKALKAAARGVLGAELATRFASYDFRHGRGMHLVGEGAPLTGVAFLLGHRRISTTDKYLRPSRRDAERALAAVGAPFSPPTAVEAPGAPRNMAESQGDRRGLNPRQLDPQRSPEAESSAVSGSSLRDDRHDATESASRRQPIRTGGGFLDRAREAIGAAFAEQVEEAAAWQRALSGALDGDQGITLGELAALSAAWERR